MAPPLPVMQKSNSPLPVMQKSNSIPDMKSVSFEEISKLFSLPFSDAAEFLGVCPSALKKICYENGLVRWPYRKFVAGKSIEEIKEDAVKEKSQRLVNLANIGGESSVQEMPKSLNMQQPQSQGSKTSVSGNGLSINLSRLSYANPDEFKYGFPSDGLSTISFRWWENSEDKQESENLVKTDCSEVDGFENETQTTNNDSSRSSSLSVLRNKAAKEGKAALKLGVYKGSGLNKLDRNKRFTLVQIFKSSLPSQWADGCLEH